MESNYDEIVRRWPFIATGPGTVGGAYLRRWWQPVYEADKLPAGKAVPLKVLGDDFTLYRGSTGTPHLVGARCPHRGTQLSTGWVEGDDLRCFYHGWKFAADGVCVEQPAEPKPFCAKVPIASYPTAEYLGLIFVFLGEQPAPPLPRWPDFEEGEVAVSMALMPCNYFQSSENIVDDLHVPFIHRGHNGLSPKVDFPIVEASETPYGIEMRYSVGEAVDYGHFVMPNSHFVNYPLYHVTGQDAHRDFRMKTLFWYVPVTDESHLHVMVTGGAPEITKYMQYESRKSHDVAIDIAEVLSGGAPFHRPTQGMRRPDMVRIQDGAAIVGQGAIADRSDDHLGATDAGVILLRKIWLRELRRLSAGEPMMPYVTPPEGLP